MRCSRRKVLSTTRFMHIARRWCARASWTAPSSRIARFSMTTHPSPSQSLDADLHGQRTRRPAPFQWMASLRRRLSIRPGNAGLIVAARGLRSFSYGMLAVLLAVALTSAGISPAAIGGIITVSLAGDFCGTYVIGLNADRWGRRRTLIVLAL